MMISPVNSCLRISIAFCVLQGASWSAQADVFRCVSPNNSVMYSEASCGANAVLMKASYHPRQMTVVAHFSSGEAVYRINGRINDKPVKFLVDTGAAIVSIPKGMRGELELYEACEQRMFETAAGMTYGCVTRAKELSIGFIKMRDIEVSLMDGLKTPLLGMNAIQRMGPATLTDSGITFSSVPLELRN